MPKPSSCLISRSPKVLPHSPPSLPTFSLSPLPPFVLYIYSLFLPDFFADFSLKEKITRKQRIYMMLFGGFLTAFIFLYRITRPPPKRLTFASLKPSQHSDMYPFDHFFILPCFCFFLTLVPNYFDTPRYDVIVVGAGPRCVMCYVMY